MGGFHRAGRRSCTVTPGDVALRAAAALRAGEAPSDVLDLVIVGAGPAGLSAAQAAWEAGLEFLILERENLAAHWRRYPGDMSLVSTVEETELPGFALAASKRYLTRQEAIDYFVAYARRLGLDRFVVPRVTVEGVDGEAGAFLVRGRHSTTGEERPLRARVVVMATGAFSEPRPLAAPGADLPIVRRWFGTGSDHVGEDVVVVGAGNSAVEAAIELVTNGAKSVTHLVRAPALRFYRETGELSDVREGSEAQLNAILRKPPEATRYSLVFDAEVEEFRPTGVAFRTPAGRAEARADWVYALTGYGFDEALYQRLGVPLGPEGPVVSEDRETMRAGVYVAGGSRFIQHFRKDGRAIVAHALVHHLPKRSRR